VSDHVAGRRGQIISLMVVVLILSLAKMVYERFEQNTFDGIHLQSALHSSTGEQVELPFFWAGGEGVVEQQRYQVQFFIERLSVETQFLYIPRYEQALQVQLNGTKVEGIALKQRWLGPLNFNTALIPIPSELMVLGDNHLQLTVATGPLRAGSLSSIHIASWDDLEVFYRFRGFIEGSFKWINYGMSLFLLLATLVVISLRPKDRVYGWLAISIGVTLLFRIGLFAELEPDIILLVPYLFLLAPIGGMAFLGFSIELTGRRAPNALLVAAVLVTLGCYLLLGISDYSVRSISLSVVAPILLINFIVAPIIITIYTWRHPTVETAVLFSGSLIMSFSIAHDILARYGLLETDFNLTYMTTPILITGVAIFLMRRQTVTANALDNSKHELEARLAEREQELKDLFKEQQQLEKRIAIESERNRITSELHDGVASHLSTIVALSEIADVSHQTIKTTAKHALDELRMVIEAFSAHSSDLDFALAVFRERFIDPIGKMGIDIEWSIADLHRVKPLTPDQILNILRILQEAITNAVKHGKPERIILTGEYHHQCVEIAITNQGGRGFTAEKMGHGIANMQMRADTLPDGALEITPLIDGAVLVLSFTASADKKRQ
jgi:two-component system, NarL family, sensor histidine kinase UhpB